MIKTIIDLFMTLNNNLWDKLGRLGLARFGYVRFRYVRFR